MNCYITAYTMIPKSTLFEFFPGSSLQLPDYYLSYHTLSLLPHITSPLLPCTTSPTVHYLPYRALPPLPCTSHALCSICTYMLHTSRYYSGEFYQLLWPSSSGEDTYRHTTTGECQNKAWYASLEYVYPMYSDNSSYHALPGSAW